MGFTPSFNALFSGGLVEQLIATVQNTQQGAFSAYPETPYGPLELIQDFHKGRIASPQYPSLTVVAGDPIFKPGIDQTQGRNYDVVVTAHLDIRQVDPDQLADWSYHYARILDQIFTTAAYGMASSVVFETAQPITWPNNTGPRSTTPFAQGSVKSFEIGAHHVGLIEGDENGTPGHRISVSMRFEMLET